MHDNYDDDDLNSVHYGESSHYCKHGTYVGSWAGPDYMCGWCEDGVSDADFKAAMEANAKRHEEFTGQQMFFRALGACCRLERDALGLPEHEGLNDESWNEFILWMVDQYARS